MVVVKETRETLTCALRFRSWVGQKVNTWWCSEPGSWRRRALEAGDLQSRWSDRGTRRVQTEVGAGALVTVRNPTVKTISILLKGAACARFRRRYWAGCYAALGEEARLNSGCLQMKDGGGLPPRESFQTWRINHSAVGRREDPKLKLDGGTATAWSPWRPCMCQIPIFLFSTMSSVFVYCYKRPPPPWVGMGTWSLNGHQASLKGAEPGR